MSALSRRRGFNLVVPMATHPEACADSHALNNGYSYEERVRADAGGTVLDYLAQRHRHSDRSTWEGRVLSGEVELDGRCARPDSPVRPGQMLVWHRPPWPEPVCAERWEVLHEDGALLAVIKPRGLPTVSAGGFLQQTLLAQVRERYPDAIPMHRLGRETSGLVLFARTTAAASSLQRDWREHEVVKIYRALGLGTPTADRLVLATPIGPVPHPRLGRVYAAHPDGRPARSEACVLERRAGETLFAVSIETGRPHQIRIHLAAAGHPLVGDPLYASGGLPRADTPGLPGDGGYFLHAAELTFTHPVTGTRMTLRAPPPPELCTEFERTAAGG